MKHILFALGFPLYLFSSNFLEVSLDRTINNQFENHIFYDTKEPNQEHLSTNKSYYNLNLNGNFNEMIGIDISRNNISGDNSYKREEIYFGTPSLKFIAYAEMQENMNYAVQARDILYNAADNKTIFTTRDITQYTVLSYLTVTSGNFQTKNMETLKASGATSSDELVTRVYDLEIRSISSENFYETTKEDAINEEDYIYPGAISQNITPWLRLYGVGIIAFENYDYTRGEAHYMAKNEDTGEMEKTSIFTPSDNAIQDDDNYINEESTPANGRYKGFAYGYKLTLEAHLDNFSFFITSFNKKTELKNYATKLAEGYKETIVSLEKLTFKEKYTKFGIRYRF